MSTAAVAPAIGTRRRRRSRRWLRLAVPFAVLVSVWVLVGVAHAVEEPDLDEPGTLSPLGTGRDGSSVLAGLLRRDGVAIERVTSSTAAIRSAGGADATIFVPTPDFLTPGFLSLLDNLAGAHRVVVVQPGLRTLIFSPVPIFPIRDRWATAALAPRCAEEFATAGTAAVFNHAYQIDAPASVDCYFGAVAGVLLGDTEFIYVGASDPFRNGRIREHGNATLATALLGEHERVVWVDVHAREPVSRSPVDLPQPELPAYRRGEQERGSTGNPTIDAFPPVLWAALMVALAAAVLLALARARRLGPPVAEPLPVLVPAAEAVTGRGRLYQRIQARAASLQALRAAALVRIIRTLNPFPPVGDPPSVTDPASPAATSLVEQVAARTGRASDAVRAILFGPPPDNDRELSRAVAHLDELVQAVLRDNPSRPAGGTP